MPAILPPLSNVQPFSGVAAAAGGTFVVNFAVPANRAVYLRANVLMTHLTAGALSDVARIAAACVVSNKGGVLTFSTIITGSANPDNSGGLAATAPETCDAGFTNAGVFATAAWTIVGANAVLTITNPGLAIAADVLVLLESLTYGSV